MKRIKAECLEQTIHFQLKDGLSMEDGKMQIRQEYESYKEKWTATGRNTKSLRSSTSPMAL